MDGTQLPITISLVVGAIGLIGLLAAAVAWKDVSDQRAKLRQGRSALADLPDSPDESIDYRQWLKERHLDDSHFGDHLRSASDARRSGRGISLSELHQVSARREARRWSARVSGGVTGLLLVCGIAGTLWCIKPVLSAFKVSASAGAVVSGAGSADFATTMIHDLGEAFWPSLVALVLTVVIAFARGLYTHVRGILAGELDQLDLEDLFPRFPPPSLGRELDGVRAQLGELAAQMSASQGNFNNFVTRLSKAAEGLGDNGPPLANAAQQFTTAATVLAPKIDDLIGTLSGHLGPGAPLVAGLGALQVVCGQVATATEQIRTASNVLSEDILLSDRVLREVAEQLPAQIEAGCKSASAIIADRAAAAIAGARVEAVQALEAAAVPVRQAADGINQANQKLRADVARMVDAGVADMEQAFTQHLHGVVATIGQAQGSVAAAVNQVSVAGGAKRLVWAVSVTRLRGRSGNAR